MAIGPPIIIPIVPVKNITNAFQPKLNTAFKSILNVIKTNAAGSKYLLATKYKLVPPSITSPFSFIVIHSGAISPTVVNKAGTIYAKNNPGTIL